MSKSFLNTSLNQRLFDFIITQNHSMQNEENMLSVFFGDWRLSHSSTTPLKIHAPSAETTYYFLGSVFELNHSLPRNSIGHYVGLEYNHNDKLLRLFRSRNSFLGIYYTCANKIFTFWGHFPRARNFMNCILDTQSVENFFNEGVITDGSTLFKGVHQLGFQKQLLYSKGLINEVPEVPLKTDSPLNLSPAEFLEFTMERFSEWFKHCHYNSMAISGGADSRLLLATLKTHPTEKVFSLHSRCHPQLTPEQDADVLIARSAAKVINKELLLQRSQGFPTAYLSQEFPASIPIMSGLYGGEILGGELIHLVSRVRAQDERDSSFAESLSACAQMFVCDFYEGAWSLCSVHHNLTLTPYWDSYFIAAMLQTPTAVIKDYSFLSSIYQHLPADLNGLPFVSPLPMYHPMWEKPLPGVNPKSIKPPVEALPTPETWLKYKNSISDRDFRVRANTLWFYLRVFYGLADEDLLSLI